MDSMWSFVDTGEPMAARESVIFFDLKNEIRHGKGTFLSIAKLHPTMRFHHAIAHEVRSQLTRSHLGFPSEDIRQKLRLSLGRQGEANFGGTWHAPRMKLASFGSSTLAGPQSRNLSESKTSSSWSWILKIHNGS
ncbi:uncharacterized protein G2W53_022360 [Senna tora]|uniref:Uncharacterized protein n=1 Tax=Senna tora TaxID=362788 RepID=A0A834TNI4_9FABA|nr:uncharacterized protein G2W53_022360 [Senna tora]